MFLHADWTHPQTGGLLTQIIEKEERQLREPKPKAAVKNVWDPRDLSGRPSTWRDIQSKPSRDTLKLSADMAIPVRECRTSLLHARNMAENFKALHRSMPQEMTRLGNDMYHNLHPTYGQNDSFASATSAPLVGIGNVGWPVGRPKHGRQTMTGIAIHSRNCGDRGIVEDGERELRQRSRHPPITPTRLEQKKELIASQRTQGSLGQAQRERRAEGRTSAFCQRPGDTPVHGVIR